MRDHKNKKFLVLTITLFNILLASCKEDEITIAGSWTSYKSGSLITATIEDKGSSISLAVTCSPAKNSNVVVDANLSNEHQVDAIKTQGPKEVSHNIFGNITTEIWQSTGRKFNAISASRALVDQMMRGSDYVRITIDGKTVVFSMIEARTKIISILQFCNKL